LPDEAARESHREFCRKNKGLPLFLQDWWLDAVCSGDWGAVTAEKGGEFVATLPYYMINRYGFRVITMPKLTQSMGPFIKYPEGQKRTSRLAYEKSLCSELVDALPPHAMFSQTFHYAIGNWLPFHWRGFKETTRYTYVLSDLSAIDEVYAGIQKNIRTEIRNAEAGGITVHQSDDLDELYRVCSLTFGNKELSTPFRIELLRRIDAEASKRGCRRILFARDTQGVSQAAVYMVWDDNTAHYILGGSDPTHRETGAPSLALWRAIEEASKLGRALNFEGSMIESIEQYFRSFGGEPIPYFHITKVNSGLLRLLLFLRGR
jgi:hypothetical protein